MHSLRAFGLRLLGFLRVHRAEADFTDELESHVALHIEDGMRAGLTLEEARRQALIHLGGAEQTRQAQRERRMLPWVDSFLQDARYALRTLRRTPGFSITAVLTLALGIGSCTAIFSLVNAVLLRSLPYGEPNRLVYLFTPNPHISVPDEVISPGYADFFDIKAQSKSFTGMTAFEQKVLKLESPGAVSRVGGARVDESFFTTLEAQLEFGRPIRAEENRPGHDKVAIISHSLWQSLFAGSLDVLERTLLLDGVRYKIIGVMPPGFAYPSNADLLYGESSIKVTNIWVPLALTPQQRAQRDIGNDFVVARLRPGVTRSQAEAEMKILMARLDKLHAGFEFTGFTALVKNFLDNPIGSVRPLMRLLLAVVGMVLLIACGNAANLLLARAANRMRELGVRVALGAGRNRIIRQLLTESLLIGLAAGAIGVGLTWLFLRILPLLDPGNIPRINQASLDPRVLVFCLVVSILTSILSGMLPAWTLSRVELTSFLAAGNGQGTPLTQSRWQSMLVVAESALVVVLLTGAGLFLRSYMRVAAIDTGFSPSTFKTSVWLGQHDEQPTQDHSAAFKQLIDNLRALPGFEAVGAIDYLPLGKGESMGVFFIDGYANRKDQMAEGRSVTPEYFRAMRTPLVAGRYFLDHDATSRQGRGVIINQKFAQTYFAHRNPIGGRLRGDEKSPWDTVVGVVADVRYTSLEAEAQPLTYSASYDFSHATIVVRSGLPASTVVADIRARATATDPTIVIEDFGVMGDLVSEARAGRRFQTSLLSAFALIALFLAVIGLYGLMAYSVSRRTREIGIRMALGAQRPRVMLLILAKAAFLQCVGLMVGLALAWAASRLMTAFLFGVGAHDPVTILLVCLLLAGSGFVAALIPARRAASIDPMQALRAE